MSTSDHMPLDGWDHIELWVGNAKQAAYWYEHALGFAEGRLDVVEGRAADHEDAAHTGVLLQLI